MRRHRGTRYPVRPVCRDQYPLSDRRLPHRAGQTEGTGSGERGREGGTDHGDEGVLFDCGAEVRHLLFEVGSPHLLNPVRHSCDVLSGERGRPRRVTRCVRGGGSESSEVVPRTAGEAGKDGVVCSDNNQLELLPARPTESSGAVAMRGCCSASDHDFGSAETGELGGPNRETHDGTDRVYARCPGSLWTRLGAGWEVPCRVGPACIQAGRQTARIWPLAGGKYLFTYFLRYLNSRKNPRPRCWETPNESRQKG